MLARGALELIWEGCYESGDDYLGTASDIETAVGWNGAHGALTKALEEAGAPEGSGFIEIVSEINGHHTYKVHDLWHHAPEYVQKRHRREMERRQRVAPSAKRRRSAPNGKHRTPSPGSQPGLDRTPSPSPALAPAPSPSPAPAHGNTETRLAPRAMSPSDLMALWNDGTTRPLPKCRELTRERTRRAQSRLRDRPQREEWIEIVRRVEASDFCRGQTGGTWVASFDWLLQPDAGVKVLEGKYDNRPRAPAQHQHPTKGAANMKAADDAFEAIYGVSTDADPETHQRRIAETRGPEVVVPRPPSDRRH